MITITARLTCQEGKEEEAMAFITEMTKEVEANEPGALAYIAHRSKDNPSEIVFFEVYKDAEALQAHGKTDHMQKMNKNFMNLFTPPPKIETLERFGGFSR